MKTIVRRKPKSQLRGAVDELSPLLRRLFVQRGVTHTDELDYSLIRLLPPEQLRGVGDACEILCTARDKKILILGDYDTDGATATTLALLGLRDLGYARVDFLVPNRFEDGYGLSAQIAEKALTRSPDLVITVDNGITSVDGVARLNAAGVRVIITDHHLAGTQLPDAAAIINPNQPSCEFPSKNLAGVGVMFYLLLALRGVLYRDQAGNPPNLAQYLDLVALGTVADMVPLDYNNRILVEQGLRRVRAGKCRAGLRALMQVAKRRHQNCYARDFGFAIAPRLNAAGRMDDMSIGIRCLLAESAEDAINYATQLEEINRVRRKLQVEMQQRAEAIVTQQLAQRQGDGDSPAACCLFDPNWHQGVVGLVATRMREQLGQPAIVFAPTDDGKLVGSGRSVPNLHLRDLLERIATRNHDLIEKFGGHAMAAGLTIGSADFDVFNAQFQTEVRDYFGDTRPDCVLETDGELAPSEFSLENAEQLRRATPWGQGFPTPVFDGEFRVLEQRVVGAQHLKMKLAPVDGDDGNAVDAIAFYYQKEDETPPQLDLVRVVYELQVNEFNNARGVQMVVEYLEAVE